MSDIAFLEAYMEKLDLPLVVEQERYGGGYRAVTMPVWMHG